MATTATRIKKPLNEQKRVSSEAALLYEFGEFTVSSGSGNVTLVPTDLNHQAVFIIVHPKNYPTSEPTFDLAFRRGASGGYYKGPSAVNKKYATGVDIPLIGTFRIEVTNASADEDYIYEVYYV